MGCRCVDASAESVLGQWRGICQAYYFQHDETHDAKAILDVYEGLKLDQVAISIPGVGSTSSADATLASLGLAHCPIADHSDVFYTNLTVLERVKNQVRAEFHAYASKQRYAEFAATLAQRQSVHYLAETHPVDGTPFLTVRLQEGYLRTRAEIDAAKDALMAFLTQHNANIGAHPFLQGLRRFIQGNIAKANVLAWRVSDAAFVESGGSAFASSALSLLIEHLHCGHLEVAPQTRLFYMDPYMSNAHLRELIVIFRRQPPMEGRPTGDEVKTIVVRQNPIGLYDEPGPLFLKFCTLL
ncbi:hypothetical protein SPRG_20518 [Saprolegnia parasitica CBS 223.65]|uniref:Uncharacterized protein n=1 Tax=Saprolegnia parasitica (strain CBS 223.65) TaxID=695850 RepID=A0A067CC45_SAPPC|nr:hypothetical protein SPRG_20518 [Saprolegnia parasitica CBS 223.65]KDO26720.1 hypothetical protein SPRG_20518 [Saprolegnia parasitica CBS 223.65]|eukprot:XP_012202604.1 hypothetical protein SPRG_20518 [Saprolegnia parasitica CBS 223.65]